MNEITSLLNHSYCFASEVVLVHLQLFLRKSGHSLRRLPLLMVVPVLGILGRLGINGQPLLFEFLLHKGVALHHILRLKKMVSIISR